MKYSIKFIIALVTFINIQSYCFSQHDTLTVMAYNVLHYGDGCQGSFAHLDSNLKIIIQYANPDIFGMVKSQPIKSSASDPNGYSPINLQDSIILYALDAAYPGRYACTPISFTNEGFDKDMDLLFYNQNKLGYVSTTLLCNLEEIFSLYKLYYKDPNLSTTMDTTFLHIILNHTVSGSVPNGPISRDHQDSLIVNSLKAMYSHLPNVISMGDFNTHSSDEAGYILMTQTTDTSFLFHDPPFSPDNKLSYPISWETATQALPYLNTATRFTDLPNGCGSSGGAKDWYLHMFLSGWIINNYDYIKYVPNSYKTLGNDGNRGGISINDSTTVGKNLSAPSNVINALYQFSDKYPILSKLAVTYNTTGKSPAYPINTTATVPYTEAQNLIRINNPIQNNTIDIHFASSLNGQAATMSLYDLSGKLIQSQSYSISSTEMNFPFNLNPGMYVLSIQTSTNSFSSRIIR